MDGVLLYISLVKIETYLVITDALTYPNSRHTYSVKADFVCYHRLNEISYSSRQTRRLHGYMGNLRRISLISRTSPKFILNSFTMLNFLVTTRPSFQKRGCTITVHLKKVPVARERQRFPKKETEKDLEVPFIIIHLLDAPDSPSKPYTIATSRNFARRWIK